MKIEKSISLFFIFFITTLWSNNEKWEYPLFEKQKQEIKILTYEELQTLKNSSPPQLVYYYDWELYQANKKILTKGILFTYRNLLAKESFIAGNFTNEKLMPMKRNKYGVFYHIHKLNDNNELNITKYLYRFFIDGIWNLDPSNQNKAIINNTEISIFEFDDFMNYHLAKTEILKKHISKNPLESNVFLVEFKIHESHLKRILNKDKINSVSIVSNFNFWNPYSNFLEKDEKGIYRWKTKLFKGNYFYNFVVDGEWILDPLNENTKFLPNFGKIFNYIVLE